MKKKALKQTLSLKKITIARLSQHQAAAIHGGAKAISSPKTSCVICPPTIVTSCLIICLPDISLD